MLRRPGGPSRSTQALAVIPAERSGMPESITAALRIIWRLASTLVLFPAAVMDSGTSPE
jgi:hypothetical protein